MFYQTLWPTDHRLRSPVLTPWMTNFPFDTMKKPKREVAVKNWNPQSEVPSFVTCHSHPSPLSLYVSPLFFLLLSFSLSLNLMSQHFHLYVSLIFISRFLTYVVSTFSNSLSSLLVFYSNTIHTFNYISFPHSPYLALWVSILCFSICLTLISSYLSVLSVHQKLSLSGFVVYFYFVFYELISWYNC